MASMSTHLQFNGVECFYGKSEKDPIPLLVKRSVFNNKELSAALLPHLLSDLIRIVAEYAQTSLASFPALREQAQSVFKGHNISIDWEAPIDWTFAALSGNVRVSNLFYKFQPGYTHYLFSQGTFEIQRVTWKNTQSKDKEPVSVSTSSFVASGLPEEFLPLVCSKSKIRISSIIVGKNVRVDGVSLGIHVDTWIVRCNDTKMIDSHLFTHAVIEPSEEDSARAIESRMAQHAAALKVVNALPVNLSEGVSKLNVVTRQSEQLSRGFNGLISRTIRCLE